MVLTDELQRETLDKQTLAWEAEMQRLASQIAAARGTGCAVVMILPTDEGYSDVAPELILEDAMRVGTFGWPDGFNVQLLNPTN